MHSEGSSSTVSRYRIVQRIASGGMGSVYLATQHGAAGFRRIVAVKRAFPQLLEDPKFRSLMASEVRLAALVRHPNVVAISDVEESEGELSLVMEYIEGASLAELLKHPDYLPPELGLRVVLDAAAGLQAVHECTDEEGAPLALVHRDISPQNILVGVDGAARIADFGIAQIHHPSSDSTVSGLLRGKPGYMAPEYVETSMATPACDVFALAIIAWEVLTRQRLFRYGSDIETLDRVRAAEVVPPSLLASGISPELDAVILRALSRRPEDRYPTARAFGDALEAALRDSHRLGTHRGVGAFVRQTAGATLSERRLRVNQQVSTSTIAAPRSQAASAPEIPVVLGVGTGSTRIEAPRSHTRSSRPLLSGLAVVLAIVATTGTAAFEIRARHSEPPHSSSRPAPVPTPSVSPPPSTELAFVVPPPSATTPPAARERVPPRAQVRPPPAPPVVRLAVAIDASAAAPPVKVSAKAPENPYGHE